VTSAPDIARHIVPKPEIGLPVAPRRERTPHVPADLRVAELMERHAHELLSEAAEIRARAADEAPQDDELISVAEIAKMKNTTKDAARKQLKRAGVGVIIAGRLYAPRAALARLYVRNVLSNVAFVPSLRTPD
jgi:hypothetical protein